MSSRVGRQPLRRAALMAVIVVGVSALVVGLMLDRTRSKDPRADQVSTIYVIGDSYTSGSGEGGVGPNGWPRLVNTALGDRYTVLEAAVGGAGYASKGLTGKTFGDLTESLTTPDARLVVVFGSRNDAGLAFKQDALDTFATIREKEPTARILAIGTPWVSADVPEAIMTVRNTVKASAAEAGVTFVDPIAAKWFFDRPDLFGSDGIHPTDAGHRYLAERIAPIIGSELKQR